YLATGFKGAVNIDEPTTENALFDATPEERDRYLEWWHRFKMLDRANWLGIGLVLGSSLLSGRYSWSSWRTVGVAGFCLFLVTRVWMRALTCPRCGATYSGGVITVINRFSPLSTCYGCDLSKRGLAALEREAAR